MSCLRRVNVLEGSGIKDDAPPLDLASTVVLRVGRLSGRGASESEGWIGLFCADLP